jgi:hypothetical protein
MPASSPKAVRQFSAFSAQAGWHTSLPSSSANCGRCHAHADERQASLALLHFSHTLPDFTKTTTVVSHTPSRGITLRQIIRIAAKGYEGSVGSWDQFINDNGRLRNDADTGDTLVTFIIREFGDIRDEAANTGDQLVVARAAIAGAIGNLERVLSTPR